MTRAVAAVAVAVLALMAADVTALAIHHPTPTVVRAAAPPPPAPPPAPTDPSSVGPSPLASRVPTDPAGLAAQLAATETAIRSPSTPAGALGQLGQLEQLDYGSLGSHPGWDAQVIASIPEGLRRSATLILDAGRQLDALDGPSTPSFRFPPWHIVAPLPPATLLAYYADAGASTGVPPTFLAAINLVETRMGRIRGNSSAGAQGPMQFLPATWAIYGAGGDINDPHDAIAGAARLLQAHGAPANMANAVYHYNPSRHYVDAVTDYATVMASSPREFLGLYQWQVYVPTPLGDFLLPVGYQPR